MFSQFENIDDLKRRISESDETAFTELFVKFDKKLVSFAKSIVRMESSAEEIVNDVFVNIWESRNTILQINNLTTYLYIAVKNGALNFLSQKANHLVTAPFDFLEIEHKLERSPADIMISEEMMKKLNEAIDQLPPRAKMIFKLVREDGLKYKEIANILNISVSTIDSQMAIAVKRICEVFDIFKKTKKQFANMKEWKYEGAGKEKEN